MVRRFAHDGLDRSNPPSRYSLWKGCTPTMRYGNISPLTDQMEMFRMVSRLHVPYIYMSRKATMKEVMLDCAEVVDQLRFMGQNDIVLDPGFGFGKTVEDNYAVMGELERMEMLHLPVLVGISRKSMIYKLLHTSQEQALNCTTALNTIALMKGASILRVHDVREAVECVKMVTATNRNSEIVK